ncbi:MAG: hypothetical protein IT280_09640 [Ignavibacteria bacterium]|nr:hypothetical protein [Ignavibacteria bacterium]
MKKSAIIAIIFALVTVSTFSQFKEIPNKTRTKLKNSSNGLILGFINPKNFSISHSFNMSVMTGSNASVSLASYTATMNYKVLKNMNLSADVTLQYSPYASIGSNNPGLNKDFQNSFNGINLSRVSLDYQPTKDMYISINYFNTKGSYYGYDNNYYGYYNPFWYGR